MPVSLNSDMQMIVLDGACVVEEAESLNDMLMQHGNWSVDASECEYLHTAVLQVLISHHPRLVGLPKPPHLKRAMQQIFASSITGNDLTEGK